MKINLLIVGFLAFSSMIYSPVSLSTSEPLKPISQEKNESATQSASSESELLKILSQLEKASWEAVIKHDTEFFRTYMAPEFKAFLADGTTADRDDFISNLDDFQLTHYTMGKTSLLKINNDAVIILYKLSYEGIHKGKKIKKSNIESSSLYALREQKWLEIFYQETQAHKR
jgi:hypothetical protein